MADAKRDIARRQRRLSELLQARADLSVRFLEHQGGEGHGSISDADRGKTVVDYHKPNDQSPFLDANWEFAAEMT
jgi:hypothetical protein